MLRGTINEQFLKRERKGAQPAIYGPYHVLSRREGNKTVSVRLNSEEALEQAKADIANHERFRALCAQLESLTERLGQLERSQQEQDAQLKKKPRRPQRRTRK
jgi:hypothetical protein